MAFDATSAARHGFMVAACCGMMEGMPGGRPRSVDLDTLERLYKAAQAAGRPVTAEAMREALAASAGVTAARNTVTLALVKLTEAGRIKRRTDGRRRGTYMSQLLANASYPLAPGQSKGYIAGRLNRLSNEEHGYPPGDSDSARDTLSAAKTMAAYQRNKKQVWDVNKDGVMYLRPAKPWELDEDGELVSLVVQRRPSEGEAGA